MQHNMCALGWRGGGAGTCYEIYISILIDHHRPGMIDLAVLNIRKRFAYQLMHGLLLLHGRYEQILAQIVNAIDGANNAGSAGAEELEELYKKKVQKNCN